MTDETPTTPHGWTRADTDALLDAALARPGDFGDTAFLPPSPEDAERQRVQRNAVGATITWDNIVTMYQRMLPTRFAPSHQPSEEAGRAFAAYLRSIPSEPAVLSTEHPFPISYNAEVWEQLHPLTRRAAAMHYLPNPLSDTRKR